ncbi:MAG: flagellar basal body P-ring formation chaperone FlgA [Caldimicrobium sp.]
MKKTLIFLLLLFANISFFNFSPCLAKVIYTEKDLREIFIKEFQKRADYPKEAEITLEKFRVEPTLIDIPREVPYKVEWIGNAKAGSNTALFIFNIKGAERQIFRAWGYIEVKIPVVVVKNPLANQAIIGKEDLALEKRELSRLPQDVILSMEEAMGKETRMSIKGGSVLRRSHIAEPLLIKRNQEVEIIAKSKYFEVKAKGISLQPGRLNEWIRVKNLSSQKIIQAKVVDEGKVEVSY